MTKKKTTRKGKTAKKPRLTLATLRTEMNVRLDATNKVIGGMDTRLKALEDAGNRAAPAEPPLPEWERKCLAAGMVKGAAGGYRSHGFTRWNASRSGYLYVNEGIWAWLESGNAVASGPHTTLDAAIAKYVTPVGFTPDKPATAENVVASDPDATPEERRAECEARGLKPWHGSSGARYSHDGSVIGKSYPCAWDNGDVYDSSSRRTKTRTMPEFRTALDAVGLVKQEATEAERIAALERRGWKPKHGEKFSIDNPQWSPTGKPWEFPDANTMDGVVFHGTSGCHERIKTTTLAEWEAALDKVGLVKPDPRDARIAELEAQLAAVKAALGVA